MNEKPTIHFYEKSQEDGDRDESGDEDGQWLNRTNTGVLKSEHYNLLVKIDQLGSIVKAARAVGIRYKTAWDMIMAISNYAGKSLVHRLTTSSGEGVTLLTEEGKRIVSQLASFRWLD